MAVKIADLKHRITFQQLTNTPDGQGGFTEAWANIASVPEVWAKVEPVSASERFFSQQIQPLVTHKVTIRWRNDLNASMRISHEGRIFQIHGIRSLDEERFWTLIDAQEGVGT